MAFDKKILLATTLIAGLAMTAPAWAQAPQTQAERDAAARRAAEAAAAQGTDVEEVVITGSRIRRNEFTSAAPVQVLTSEQAELEGIVDTTELLQQSSVASGSSQTNNQLTGFVTTGGPGVNTVSLRGLGAQRSLVLVNGRRAGPAGSRGQVGAFDLNVIPQGMIERVEILKDGASSIYGSDAIAGVINIITKTNLDGGSISAYATVPEEQGGEQYRVNGAWGKTFDRGYINFGADWYRQEPLRRRDRDDTSCAQDYYFNGTNPSQRLDYVDPTTNSYKCFNQLSRAIRTVNYGDVIYPDAGLVYPTVAQGNSGGTNNAAGAFGGLPIPYGLIRQTRAGFPATYPYAHFNNSQWERATVLSPVNRYTLTSNFGFDLTPSIEMYGEVLLNRRVSSQDGARQLFPTVALNNNNNIFGSNPGGLPNLVVPVTQQSTILPLVPLVSDAFQTVDYARGVLGFRGDFGSNFGLLSGWDWDIYAQYSKSDADYTNDIIYNDRVNAVIGGGTCNQAAITLSGSLPGGQCSTIPGGIPWSSARVLEGQFTNAEAAFLFARETGHTTYTHQYIEGSISGDLFSLPAGPVGAAIGFQVRKEELNDTPGLQARTGNLWGSTSAGITAGTDSIRELFGELEVPLIRGVPFVDSLTLNLSGRYSDYDSYGSNHTGKIGLNWQISPAWRIRATNGTSFRAPALYELFLQNQTGFQGQLAIDPCAGVSTSPNPTLIANCTSAAGPGGGVPLTYTGAGTSSATIVTGGGAGVLNPETSDATSFGVVWTPSFIDLSIAVDYFDITVDNEVRSLGAATILNLCYTAANFPASAYCTLFSRNTAANEGGQGANAINIVRSSYINVSSQTNRGLDLAFRYGHEFSYGDATLTGNFTWQFEDVTLVLPGTLPNDFNGSTTEPDFTGGLDFRFDHGDWTFAYGVDFISKASDNELTPDTVASTRFSSTCLRTGGNPVGSTTAAGTLGPCSTLLGTGPVTVQSGTAVTNGTLYTKIQQEFTTYHDMSIRYRHDDWTLQFGIQNLFDEAAPALSANESFRVGTFSLNQYDPIGRRAFFNVTKRF